MWPGTASAPGSTASLSLPARLASPTTIPTSPCIRSGTPTPNVTPMAALPSKSSLPSWATSRSPRPRATTGSPTNGNVKQWTFFAALQVDRSGDRSRPTVERLLDTEHVRDAVGQVAVPFGICTEPTNVKAHGQACPFRHQCFGCTQFRSDPSFLPELRAQLGRLLTDRERLRAAAPELEDWARHQAIPGAEEIGAVRRIIDRCQSLLDDVGSNERTGIDEAIAVLRRDRAQLDTTMPVRFLGVVAQRSPTLFPNVRREQETNSETT